MSSNRPDDHVFEVPYQSTVFDTEVVHAEYERKQSGSCCACGCCLGCLIFLMLVLLGIGALYYAIVSGGVPLTVSEETTIITEPLKSDGATIDFHQAIRAMIEPDVPLEENGFMTVWRGYGREIYDPIVREDIRQQYLGMCDHFGVDPAAMATWTLPHWTPETPEQWVATVREGLDAVQIAAASPHYFVPLVRQSEHDLVIMSQPLAIYAFHERLSDALRLRADVRFLREGDISGAWKDILTSIRLFRLVTVNHAWMQEWSGRDSESLLTPVAEITVTLQKWTPQQLEQAINDLELLPKWQDQRTMRRIIQFMLLDALSATNDLHNFGNRFGRELPQAEQFMLQAFQLIGFDWNLVAKELNREMESYGKLLDDVSGESLEEQFNLLRLRRMDEPFRMPDEEETQTLMIDHFNRTGGNPFFAPGRSQLSGAVIGYLGVRAVGEMYRLQLIEDSRIQALRLALALEQFRREYRRYPDSLAEIDGLPGMHLQYERREEGYRLWNSVVQLSVD